MQEIKDAEETAIYELLNLINDESGVEYGIELSPRVGKEGSSYKEQYAYIYR